jgi:hypothetical protein
MKTSRFDRSSQVVHTLDEAFSALGVQSSRLEPWSDINDCAEGVLHGRFFGFVSDYRFG